MATATVDSQKVSKPLLSKERQNKTAGIDGQVRVQDILMKSQEKNLDRVYEVDLHACKLTKIEHCQSFPKLRILDVSCNQIKSLRGLDKNIELKELKLYSNRISKIECLEKLKELCALHLQDNNIPKIGNGLQSLKKLKVLRLDGNKIQTITLAELAPCSKLTSLNISRNAIEDISFLNSLPLLEEFYASYNHLKRIPDIGRCKKLKEIDLSYNTISSISGLTSLPDIASVCLESNLMKTIDIPGSLKRVEELTLKNNKIRSVKKLPDQFPSIEVLDVSGNSIENLEETCQALERYNTLRELSIAGNPCVTTSDLFYHQTLVRTLPDLEVLDGTTVKRPQSSATGKRPPMRPVSASQIFSTKQLEEQVSIAVQEQESFESMISSKFDIVYDLLNKLPEKGKDEEFLPRPGTAESSPRPVSRCGNRARIQDAKAFAEQNFDDA